MTAERARHAGNYQDVKCSVCGKNGSPWCEIQGNKLARYCVAHVPKAMIERMLSGMGPRARVTLRRMFGNQGNPHV